LKKETNEFLTALVATINTDFGIINLLVATLLFLILYTYVLIHVNAKAYTDTILMLGLLAYPFRELS